MQVGYEGGDHCKTNLKIRVKNPLMGAMYFFLQHRYIHIPHGSSKIEFYCLSQKSKEYMTSLYICKSRHKFMM